MGLLQREWDVKLELLAALARSQHALARLLESAASVGEASPAAARLIRENAGLIAGLQRSVADAAFGLRLRRPAAGSPGAGAAPWLNRRIIPPARRSGQRRPHKATRRMKNGGNSETAAPHTARRRPGGAANGAEACRGLRGRRRKKGLA